MTPFAQARDLSTAAGRNFIEELTAHLAGGIVISTPDVFVMAQQDDTRLFVWLAVGRLDTLRLLLPAGVEWVGFCRQGRGWRRNHWVPVRKLR